MIKANEDKRKELDSIAYALPPANLELLVTFARGMRAGMREYKQSEGYPAQAQGAQAGAGKAAGA